MIPLCICRCPSIRLASIRWILSDRYYPIDTNHRNAQSLPLFIRFYCYPLRFAILPLASCITGNRMATTHDSRLNGSLVALASKRPSLEEREASLRRNFIEVISKFETLHLLLREAMACFTSGTCSFDLFSCWVILPGFRLANKQSGSFVSSCAHTSRLGGLF